MGIVLESEKPPLREEPDGALRVGNTRVLLELVLQAFEDGATPETIVQQYETLSLPDVYAVIAYYLRHREEMAAYMNRREQLAIETRTKIESAQSDLAEIRARLQAKRKTS